MKNITGILTAVVIVIFLPGCRGKNKTIIYEPAFASLEQVNPVPEWFKDAKFGIYFHWGVYSVPAYANEWYPRNMYRAGSPENLHHTGTYGEPGQWPYDKFITGAQDKKGNFVKFAPKLKSEGGNFDPAAWAKLFADAGARFAGPVAEHHDGFSMWASKINPWNAGDMGPELDLVGLLAKEIRNQGMRVILSMHHAYNITGFYDVVPPGDDPELRKLYGQQGKEKNEAMWLEKYKEIIDNYRPDIIWQDFNLTAVSQPVLLQFLAYYYNKAQEWNNEVVITYKDALNINCGVLDFERGGPAGLTDYYWLTDDAISSSSWCYTEGIGYYSAKQVFHGLLDRVSKNGNLLLNISPRADGTIPQEQQEVLLAIGGWLKKYGEAVYCTRAWEKYGEGPTKMGAGHGVFTAPAEGTAQDVRYTRSKDNKSLYAILLGWDKDRKIKVLTSLSSGRIDLTSLKEISLINGEPGNYLPLAYQQDENGLAVTLPDKTFDELAYVLKLDFEGTIPAWNKYAELDCTPHYYLVPGGKPSQVLGSGGSLSDDRKDWSQQWKLISTGKGIYQILSRENDKLALATDGSEVKTEKINGGDNQLWLIEETYNNLLIISSNEYPELCLAMIDQKAVVGKKSESPAGWQLLEVCGMKQTAYKPHTIPGTVEAEDFDNGCPGEAWSDRDENNTGGQYRQDAGVDIETCAAGGYNTGWANSGEWMAFTVNVTKAGNYRVDIYVATVSDQSRMHLEVNNKIKTDTLSLPDTGGYQSWRPVTTHVSLNKGTQVLKVVLGRANAGLNLDKLVFSLDI
jgi:alpha-L-fucosidase